MVKFIFLRTPRKTTFRKRMYQLHLLVALVLGCVISLVSLTGSLVVYKPELEKIVAPHLAFVKPRDQKISLDSLYCKVKESYPEYRVLNLAMYGGRNVAYSFRTSRPHDKIRVQVYVNQYTGEVLGADAYDDNFLQWVYDFHSNLFLGKTGEVLNAFLGFFTIVLLLSGLFILWPGIAKLRYFFRCYSGKSLVKRMYDMHRLVGAFSFIFLAFIAFTGAYWGFKEQYHSLFETFASGKAWVQSPKIEEDGERVASLDAILATAKSEFPEGVPSLIFFPKEARNVFSVRMIEEGDYARTGSNHIYISPKTAEVVGTNLWRNKPMAEKTTRSMYFIHFGTFGGHFTRILWVIIGCAIPFLYFSGLIGWWNKKLRKKLRKSKADIRSAIQ